ncbi:uracil-DNA glycosylase family protein [Arcobacter vandammei]|uniref:uracil-DNA glycosylase family protein n=1 Tax=Arcobacter vandammei TaxID=2782243 RepID=UPI0018DF01C6|nr:uracil-DNA glycosylase family protein [Arcobacter vandammei]
MKIKQQLLQEFYEDKFLNFKINEKYSSAHLISLEAKNINTDIMFIGQETNEWYGNWEDICTRGIVGQMNIYKDFMDKHYLTMNNLFFKYIKKIINDNNIVPVYTNLFKFDLGDDSRVKNISKAPKETLSKIIEFHKGILAKEIEIIQPKIIIFFTGHNYDKLFIDPIIRQNGDYKKLYKKIDELNCDEWKCCHLDIKEFEGFEKFTGLAYRTYHPMYLNRNLNKFGNEIFEFLKDRVSNFI